MHSLARRLRARRDQRAFEAALRQASPAMRQELVAVSMRVNDRVV